MTNEEAIIKCEDYLSRYEKLRKREDFTKNDEENIEFALVVKSALESIDRIKTKLNARDKLVDKLEDRVYKLTAERDAAIADIKEAAHFPCEFCKKRVKGCNCWSAYDKWEWRGLKDEPA